MAVRYLLFSLSIFCLVPCTFHFLRSTKVVCRLLYNFCGISIYEGFCLDSCVLLIEPNLAAWEYTHTHRHTYSQLGILACQSYSVFHIPWFSIAAGIHILGLVNGKSMHSMYICTGYQAKSISIILIFLERVPYKYTRHDYNNFLYMKYLCHAISVYIRNRTGIHTYE